ncbi:MAG: hypothetical protein RL196_1013 [Actinomycetota bacterium]|jgi:hypothetical protein
MHIASTFADRSTTGPLDISEVRELKPLHDFGSLRVPNRTDVSIRVEVEETTGQVTAVSIDMANSNVHIQPFAAPRNEALWNEIRTSIAQSISSQGGKVSERIGSFGAELLAEVATKDENGKNIAKRHLKFLGIDGPRWFLRIVVSGAAVTDPAASGSVDDLIRGLVINRGETPMPPRELLPLSMPAGSASLANR